MWFAVPHHQFLLLLQPALQYQEDPERNSARVCVAAQEPSFQTSYHVLLFLFHADTIIICESSVKVRS